MDRTDVRYAELDPIRAEPSMQLNEELLVARVLASPTRRRRVVPLRGVLVATSALAIAVGVIAFALVPSPGPGATAWAAVGNVTDSWGITQSQSLQSSGGELHCPSSSTCYARVIGADAGGSSPAAQIEVTRDAGGSWLQESLPSGYSQPTDPFADLSCPDAQTCGTIVVDGSDHYVLAVSSDGGSTWGAQPLPVDAASFAISGLSCSSSTDCVVVGWESPNESIPGTGVALATTNGGQTWAQPALPSDLQTHYVHCFAGGDCVAVGTNAGNLCSGSSCSSGSDSIQVEAAYSIDAGATWTASSLPVLHTQVSWRGVSCGSASSCVLTTAGLPGFTELISSDGGKTWSDTALAGIDPSHVLSMALSCGDALHCWSNVTQVPTSLPSDVSPGRFGPDQSQQLYATNDGGATWSASPYPQGLEQLWNLSCASATQCFALGEIQGGEEVFLATESS